ncbi:unnamed protein product [Dicrocoelium dendriticum]|nr:unnamed protein product [Dicrocoelium dendriticum]
MAGKGFATVVLACSMTSTCSFNKLEDTLLSNLESSQWRVRGDALDTIAKHINTSSLSPGDCSFVVKALLQVVGTDKHSVLVTKAATILQQLVQHLKSDFAQYAANSLSVCLAKFKDRTQSVSQALRSVARSMLDTLALDPALAVLSTSLSSPSPNVQSEATELLAYCLIIHSRMSHTADPITQPQRVRHVKPLLPMLKKLMEHRTPECREAGIQAVAATQLFLGENSREFNSLYDDLDDLRRTKVNVTLETLKSTITERNTATACIAQHSESIKNSKKCRNTRPQTSNDAYRDNVSEAPTISIKGAGHTHVLRDESGTNDSKTPSQLLPTRKSKVSKPKMNKKFTSHEENYDSPSSPEVATQNVSAYFITVPIDQLADADWKVRLVAAESMKSKISSDIPSENLLLDILHFILKSDRLRDINFQVRCTLLDIVNLLLLSLKRRQRFLTDRLVQPLCEQLVPNLPDSKARKFATDALNLIAMLSAPNVLSTYLFPIILGLKNPVVHTASLKWLASAVRSLYLRFELDEIVEVIRHALGSANPSVRTAAILLAGTVHVSPSNVKGRLRALLSEEKPVLLNRLESEFARCEADLSAGNTTTSDVSHEAYRSSSSTQESVEPGRADTTFAGGSQCRPVAKADETVHSEDLTYVEDEPAPMKGVINALTNSRQVVPKPLVNVLFFVEPNQTATLMEAKQARLAKLTKTMCIDSEKLRILFADVNANPLLIHSLFAPDVESRLESLDKLTVSLDQSDDATRDPSPLIVSYAHFDLLLAWTIGCCFAYGSICDSMTQNVIPSWADKIALATRGLQYLTVAVSRFAYAEFQLSREEVNLILHALLSDQAPSLPSSLTGTPLDPRVRDAISDLTRLLRQVYPASALMNCIANVLHQCISTSGRVACLQELISVFPLYGDTRGSNLGFSVKLVVQQIADPHAAVRQSALEFLKLSYRLVGQSFWELVGYLQPKDKQLLEQHLGSKCTQTTESTLPATPLLPTSLSQTNPTYSSHLATTGPSKLSSRRGHSPPPKHASPAALAILIPLIHERNNVDASAASRALAAQQLDSALSSLVSQLDVVGLRASKDSQPEIEDETAVLDNVILGALVDLEALVLDPRTRGLLVPFVSSIVDRLAILAHALANVAKKSAGHTVFINCVAGLLVVLFEQPFLTREATADNLLLLLAGLFQLALSTSTTENANALPNARRVMFLRLVRFILTRVEPTIALSTVLRLLSFTTFGLDCCTSNPIVLHRRTTTRSSSAGGSPEHCEVIRGLALCDRIRQLTLAQLDAQISEFNHNATRIGYAVVLPMLESLFKLLKPPETGNKDKGRRKSVPSDVRAYIRALVVTAYARFGPKLSTETAQIVGQKSSLLSYLSELEKLMPHAPYPHCIPNKIINW